MKQRNEVFAIVLILIIILILWAFTKITRPYQANQQTSQNLNTFTEPISPPIYAKDTYPTSGIETYQFPRGGYINIENPGWAMQTSSNSDSEHIEFTGTAGTISIDRGQGFGGVPGCPTTEVVQIKNYTFNATACTYSGYKEYSFMNMQTSNPNQSYSMSVRVNAPIPDNDAYIKRILSTLELK